LTSLPNNSADATQEMQATASETEEPATEETEYYGVHSWVRVVLRQ